MKENKLTFKDFKYLLSFFKEDKLILVIHILIGLICSALIVLGSFFTGKVIELFKPDINTKEMLNIVYAALITFSLYFVYWLFNTKLLVWTIKLSYRSGSRIRYAIFQKILNVPISFIDKTKVGELMSRATNDVDNMISNMVQVVVGVFTSPIIIITIFITNFVLNPLLSVIALALTLITILSTGLIAKKAAPDFNDMQNKIGDLNALNKEFITNKLAIYIFKRQDYVKDKYYKTNDKHSIASYKAEYKLGLVYPLLDILENIIYGFLIIIGVIFIIKDIPMGSPLDFNLGLLTTFVLLNRILLGEIGNVARFGSLYEKLFVCAKRILKILNEENDIDNGNLNLEEVDGIIEFKDVNFSYYKNKPIIKDFNLKVNKGDLVGIVGPTGSGKSTIMNLLMRFYEIDSGQITIDGIDIRKIKKTELRKHISIVLQETNLFSESVYTNISYGSKIGLIDKEKIQDAAKHVGSDHFINLLPKSYETIIDDNLSISQGQSQMLALTRAYYSPSSIMILDEATSSIDSKTEIDIQNGIMKLMKNKTSFIIAHRLSTIKNANQIVVLKNGQIIEKGSHEELMKNDEFYAKMYKSGLNMSED